jgi:hypothetical protein
VQNKFGNQHINITLHNNTVQNCTNNYLYITLYCITVVNSNSDKYLEIIKDNMIWKFSPEFKHLVTTIKTSCYQMTYEAEI